MKHSVDEYWSGLDGGSLTHDEQLVMNIGNFMRGVAKYVVKLDFYRFLIDKQRSGSTR